MLFFITKVETATQVRVIFSSPELAWLGKIMSPRRNITLSYLMSLLMVNSLGNVFFDT